MRLREVRKKKNISQSELGAILGVTGQTILNWENGIYEPNITQLIKLANFFNVSIDYLVERPQSTSETEIIIDALEKLSGDELVEFIKSKLLD